MQFGHLGIALAIASLDPRPETFAVVTAAQFLPNADSLVIRAGWARPEFHGTWSHNLAFCVAVGAAAALLFGPWLGCLAFASIVAHAAADLPTDTGIPLLLPFNRRRFTLNLWKNTATGAGPCTRATTASRGPGFSSARCSPWWRGATRSTSREAGGVFRARRVCARAPVAISADGVRSDAALLRALLSALAARARRHGRRLARRGGELPPGGLGGGAAETRRAGAGKAARWSVAAFLRAPFWTTVLVIFSPIPDSAVRVLAPLGKYPLPRYLGAVALGRYPRLLLVASSGALLRIPLPLLVLASVGIVLAGLGWRRLQRAGLTEP